MSYNTKVNFTPKTTLSRVQPIEKTECLFITFSQRFDEVTRYEPRQSKNSNITELFGSGEQIENAQKTQRLSSMGNSVGNQGVKLDTLQSAQDSVQAYITTSAAYEQAIFKTTQNKFKVTR